MVDKSALVLLMDGALAVLLLVGLVMTWRFNKRLGEIQRGKDEFAKLIGEFARSTEQATTTLAQLKASANTIGRDLSTAINRAAEAANGQDKLVEDLRMLIARGEATADRLTHAVSRARPLSAAAALGQPPAGQGGLGDVKQAEPKGSDHPVLSAITGLR